MSQVFEGYERQYCEISANLSKKITAASVLNGEQKKQKISEVAGGLEDADALELVGMCESDASCQAERSQNKTKQNRFEQFKIRSEEDDVG
ncbi:vesicle transport v-SNARE 13-like [Salvia splendens]|uniref:vesicle transport v-SNARE 13-like n=1 Tax=Salvia splendens TaxID=180675 RepID=UPI001C26F8B5|nr:vesicle transport v-SNARE 13-like [Salvia splendens]